MSERLDVSTIGLFADLPEPNEIAALFRIHRPDLARILRSAYEVGDRLRVPGWSQHSERLDELRALGILEATGCAPPVYRELAKLEKKITGREPPPQPPRSIGQGLFLTGFGRSVLRSLLDE